MTQKIFFISDLHLGHENCFKLFKKSDGVTPLRPFTSLEEMHSVMIERFNSRVTPEDKTYFVGDIALNPKYLELVKHFNGTKVLIKGNHDTAKIARYTELFKDIRAYHQFSGVLISHIPVHPESLGRWGVNIHGHLHDHNVRLPDGTLDKRYFNVSVEQLDYYPITLEEIKSRCGLIQPSN